MALLSYKPVGILKAFSVMESMCALDSIRGYGTMIVTNFNGGVDAHCSRMRQATRSGLRRAIQKIKRVEMDENPLRS